MKKLLLIFFAVSLHAGEANIYQSITKRNAFELTSDPPRPILPPVSEILNPSVFLTGVTRFNGIGKIHLVLRKAGEPDKFVSLAINEKQYNVELKKIYKNSALISNNGNEQLMSFKNNGLPTIVTKPQPTKKETSSKYSRDKKGSSKKEEKKSTSTSTKPHIVQVPSRRPKIDPRIIEKSLEYLSKTEDSEKRDYVMKRLESLQSGQGTIKSDIDRNERRRQYDEWRKKDK
jgi:type II secretory pathway component PulC